MKQALLTVCGIGFVPIVLAAQQTVIQVHADRPGAHISRYMTGACIEDVNHEIYGGLYSQMVFGESFQEPPNTSPLKGFTAYGGTWKIEGDELQFAGGAGDKLISNVNAFADGEVGVELFADRAATNIGVIVRVNRPGQGADTFDGYEISLNVAAQTLRLGRHRHSWEPIKDVACEIPADQWVSLIVHLTGSTIEVRCDGKSVLQHDDGPVALAAGTLGLRAFQEKARYRNLWVKTGADRQSLRFEREAGEEQAISGMWRKVSRGEAIGAFSIPTDKPFVGEHCQHITFTSGTGEVGIENQGLNRWGMYFVEGKPYEAVLWARATQPVTALMALESKDGTQVYAEQSVAIQAGDWQRFALTLTPKATDKIGRLAIKLKQSGSVDLGYVFLQPGEWGRYKGLPVRRDVAEALVDQGITILRYGGSMILADDYRWKKMIGPREQRAPYKGIWYPYSTHGWGILDFLNFCEAAGFLGIPDLNTDEAPQDLAHFIEYINGSAESEWGKRRVQDGHPQPYNLKIVQIGNEPWFNEDYVAKVKPLLEAIWAKDPKIIVVVADLCYDEPITDPYNVTATPFKKVTFANHAELLKLAKAHNREIWFDIHEGADTPDQAKARRIVPSVLDTLAKVGPDARCKVALCELNAQTHHIGRALANAIIIGDMEKLGEDRVPFVTSANCLQPDGQNDNGWDQGLLFLNPSQVWLQPPGYATRMISRNYQPWSVPVDLRGDEQLKAYATRAEDGKSLVLRVVNAGDQARRVAIRIEGFVPGKPTAVVEELSGPMNAFNTADEPNHVTPQRSEWSHGFSAGQVERTFPPRSFTVIHWD